MVNERDEYFLKTGVTPNGDVRHVQDVLNGIDLREYRKQHGEIPEKFRIPEELAYKIWRGFDARKTFYFKDGNVYSSLSCRNSDKVS